MYCQELKLVKKSPLIFFNTNILYLFCNYSVTMFTFMRFNYRNHIYHKL